MDTGVIVTAIIGIVTTIASGWTSWFFTRKKYDAEVDNTIIDSMKESLEFYQKLSDDNKKRLDEMIERNSKLEEEISELRKQVTTLMTMTCTDLSCKLRQLSRQNNE